MLKNFLIIFSSLLLSFSSLSQKGNLSGQINDLEKNNVQNTVIALLTLKDSILYKYTRSDKEGKFLIKDIKSGKYILTTSNSKYADYVDDIDIKENENKLGTIDLISKSKLLQEVNIKGSTTI